MDYYIENNTYPFLYHNQYQPETPISVYPRDDTGRGLIQDLIAVNGIYYYIYYIPSNKI